ncbi:urease accessory protein UreF [Neisseria perflava]|uniref:urease accessory protein UreF n=1 Tax=Neisseria perflava TaxID=33053 RepID=UPI00209C7951|nr:urease accessory protein UreF [Neisseria perflava]MCP1661053.1 urease accessory protein [Neisseria perflava]MCP1772322.1 urease accessory protein [Neisseria perflava]
MSTKLTSLLHLVDPTLPIGGFNHSGGLETFVQQRIVNSKADLQEYVSVQLAQSWAHNDGAYVSLAYTAATDGDSAALLKLDEKIAANKAPREVREAATKLGVRLLKIFARYDENPLLQDFQTAITQKQAYGFYPLVFGMIAALEGLPKEETLTAFYYNAAVGAITNGVKLIPLSQMDGQDILFSLREPITAAVESSLHPDQDMLGAASIASDIRAMQHERLYSRLYMS